MVYLIKKLAALLFLFILFIFPLTIAEEGTTETTQPSPPPTEAPTTTQPPETTTTIKEETTTTIKQETSGEPTPTTQPSEPSQPREEPKGDPQCSPPPSPNCNQDQKADPFYKDGCLSGYNCVSKDGQEGPRDHQPQSQCPPERACRQGEQCVPCPGQGQPGFQNVPPGCHVEQGEFGEFIKCDQHKKY